MEMIIALNNKSNLEKEPFTEYIEKINEIQTTHQIIVCPTTLNVSSTNLKTANLGAQNVSTKDNGAYTGEVSASQLKSYGVEYCIIGHSERREYQRETNEEIHEKIKKLLENNIRPILCIGETKEQREKNQVEEILKEELLTAIQDLTKEEQEKLIIAYEPIWSIGTGIIPTNEEIKEVFLFIKTILPTSKILYGGSANDENIDSLKQVKEIDGYLLGGLSLKPDKLKIFLEKCN